MRRFALFALVALSPLMAVADTGLYGSWHGQETYPDSDDLTHVVTFFDDGRFEMSITVELARDFWAELAEEAEMEISGREPAEKLEYLVSGTWHTKDDSLFFDVAELEIIIDGEDLFQIFTELSIEMLVRSVEEEWGYELDEDTRGGLAILARGMVPNFKENMRAVLDEDLDSLYYLDGDVLTIVEGAGGDSGNEDLRLERGLPSTAVEAVSWGQVKGALRP